MATIQPLSGNHNRKAFDCGRRELNDWLVRFARQHQDRGISQTFVAIDPDSPAKILGFYALNACEISTEILPPAIAAKLPRKAPGVKLAKVSTPTVPVPKLMCDPVAVNVSAPMPTALAVPSAKFPLENVPPANVMVALLLI